MNQKKQDYPIPPWDLKGDAFITFFLRPKNLPQEVRIADENYLCHRIAVLIAVDYQYSPVGSYRELVILPGRVLVGNKTYWHVSHMFVDSKESVFCGKTFWGYPKELTNIHIENNKKEGLFQLVCSNEAGSVQVVYESQKWSIPVKIQWMPKRFRYIVQAIGSELFQINYWGSAKVSPAKLCEIKISGNMTPDITKWKKLGSFYIHDFNVTMGEPELIEPQK